MGLRLRDLGSKHFTWVDLRAIVRMSPLDSALRRAQSDLPVEVTASQQLLASIFNRLGEIGHGIGVYKDQPQPITFTNTPTHGQSVASRPLAVMDRATAAEWIRERLKPRT